MAYGLEPPTTAMRESIDRFLGYMTVERGVSPNTVSAYRNDLRQLAEFVADRLPDSGTKGWSAVDAHTIALYLLELHDRGYSDTTRARKVASAKVSLRLPGRRGRRRHRSDRQRQLAQAGPVAAGQL